MHMQAELFPSLTSSIDVPIALLLLTDTLVALEGLTLEGIFRVSGHETELIQLRQQLNDGNFGVETPSDNNNNSTTTTNHNKANNNTPHHIANLFKEFLRNLKDPVIPSSLYEECIKCAEDPRLVIKIVEDKLPPLNRRVLLFVITWLQDHLLNEQAQKLTRMDTENLSIVFAGCLLASPNPDSMPMEEILRNMQMQKRFVASLLLSV